MYIIALQGHPGENLDIYIDVVSQKDGERIRNVAVSYWILKAWKRHEQIFRTCPRRIRN